MDGERVTHAELVTRAERWLRGTRRCHPVFTERGSAMLSEVPDAYGICSLGSVVVECKVTRSDFLADRRKRVRRDPARGLGVLRYYLVPDALDICGLPPDLPEGWGLLELRPRGVSVVRESASFISHGFTESVYMRSRWLAVERAARPTGGREEGDTDD